MELTGPAPVAVVTELCETLGGLRVGSGLSQGQCKWHSRAQAVEQEAQADGGRDGPSDDLRPGGSGAGKGS